MRVESSVAPDVQRDRASFDEHARDEQEPVADGGVFLAAHQRDAVLSDPLLDPFDAAEKARHAGERRVEDVSLVVVTVLFRRTAPEFLAQEQILPFGGDDLALQRLAVELRAVLRIRLGPHIDQHVDLMLLEQPDEMLVRVIGMPDREEAAIGNNEVGHGTTFLGKESGDTIQNSEDGIQEASWHGGSISPCLSKLIVRRASWPLPF